MNKQLIRIDASSLSNMTCYLRFYRHVVLGYKGHKSDISMEFGSAWHVFREELARTENMNLAIGKAIRYFNEVLSRGEVSIPDSKGHLTPSYLAQLCMIYCERFGETDKDREFKILRDSDNQPLVEQTFSLEFYEDDHVKILMQGTIDEIGKLRNGGLVAFGDDKTTGSYKIAPYLAEHEMKNQLLTYAWALRTLGERAEKSNPYKTIFSGKIGGFISGVFLKSDPHKCEFKRSDIFFYSDADLREYEYMLHHLCRRLSETVERDNYTNLPREGRFNNTCSGMYGDCNYIASCKAPTREIGERILEANFKQVEYYPLSFRKPKLEGSTE